MHTNRPIIEVHDMGGFWHGKGLPHSRTRAEEGETAALALTDSSPVTPPPAQWKTRFDPKHTEQAEFHVSKNKTVEVPMMTLDLETPYFRDKELGCTLVELTYTSNDSALFILPDKGKMQDLEAKLTPETLTRWRNSLQPR